MNGAGVDADCSNQKDKHNEDIKKVDISQSQRSEIFGCKNVPNQNASNKCYVENKENYVQNFLFLAWRLIDFFVCLVDFFFNFLTFA